MGRKVPTDGNPTRQVKLKPVQPDMEFSDSPSIRVRNKRLRKLASIVVKNAMTGATLHEPRRVSGLGNSLIYG